MRGDDRHGCTTSTIGPHRKAHIWHHHTAPGFYRLFYRDVDSVQAFLKTFLKPGCRGQIEGLDYR